jgi:hypothetical protein
MKVYIEAAKTSLGACEERISLSDRGCKAYNRKSQDEASKSFDAHYASFQEKPMEIVSGTYIALEWPI